jgi:hypothetical protein
MKSEFEEKPRVLEDQDDLASDLGATTEPETSSDETQPSSTEATELESEPARDARRDDFSGTEVDTDRGKDDFESRTPPWMKTSTVKYDEDREPKPPLAGPSLAVREAKARRKAERRRGPSRPLGALANAEADLHAHSAASAKLSPWQQRQPGKNLLNHQLLRAVDTSHASGWRADQLRNDAVALYSALQSEDAIESILDRLIVANSCSAMACHARIATTSNPKLVETFLRYAEKHSRVTIDLVEARDNRRTPKKVMVGNVKVEAGGAAIVGNVENQNRRCSENDANDEATAGTNRRRRRKR